MRPILPLRRIPSLYPFRPPSTTTTIRPLTHNTLRPRPQLPFLTPSTRRPLARFLTTETKQWIKSEFILAGKITITLWSSAVLLFMIAFGIQQEWLNHRFPSPEEWSWSTRKDFRSVRWEADVDEERNGLVDWANVGMTYLRIVKRLEDPSIDGAGLLEQGDGGILVEGIGRTGYDITNKSEPWRRGYYEVLMGLGKSAEHLEGWVMDRTRRVFFPANVVIGPSNPNPRPVPAGAKAAPKEEDCDIAFEGPETFYMRILTTKGFTDKQRMDAALAYAVWLDFKRTPDAALEVYKWALDIAMSASISKTPSHTIQVPIIDPTTNTINPSAPPPSANILSSITAFAVHQAANNNLNTALPIFLSILRARRSLPTFPQTMRSTLISDEEQALNQSFLTTTSEFLRKLIVPPPYPPPPEDGNSPPVRGAKETCEEAGVMTYIGEILYASNSGKSSREDGLAWTREAVDIAEEQLRRRGVEREAKRVCAQCLEVGMGNWAEMVRQLCEEEKVEKGKKKKSEGWLGFGGGKAGAAVSDEEDVKGRWESEEVVVEERLRRAREVLDDARAVRTSFLG